MPKLLFLPPSFPGFPGLTKACFSGLIVSFICYPAPLAAQNIAEATAIRIINGNPAEVCTPRRITLAFGYFAAFGLPELSTQQLALAFPLNRNSIGLNFQRYGSSAFNQLTTGLIYGKQFGKVLSIALAANYHQVNMDKYGHTAGFSINAGAQYSYSKNIVLSAYMINPSKEQYPAKQLKLPIESGYAAGIAWKSTAQINLESLIHFHSEHRTELSTGLSYLPSEKFNLRAGLTLQPLTYYTAFVIFRKTMQVDCTVRSNSIMGYTSKIVLSYAW